MVDFFGSGGEYYASFLRDRNKFVADNMTMAAPVAGTATWGGGPNAPDAPTYSQEDWDYYAKYQAEADRLRAQWLETLSPEQKAMAIKSFADHSANIDSVNKIGKAAAITIIGAVGAGAALTAAGVIGGASTTATTGAVEMSAAGMEGAGYGAAGAVEMSAAGMEGAGYSAAAGGAAAGGGAATPAALAKFIDPITGLVKDWGGLINAGLGIATAVTAAKAAKDQAEEEQRTAEYNAQEAEHAARNALLRGEEDARDLRRSGSLLQGAQRASYAGRGVSLNEGSPAAAINQTDFFTDQDISTARSNAETEAATYRRQGARFNAQAGYINPSRTGGLSLVGGLATVASRWYDRYGN